MPLLTPRLARWLVERSLGVWLAVRAVLAAFLTLSSRHASQSQQIFGGVGISIAVVVIVAILTLLETRRRSELFFFALLGVPAMVAGAVVVCTSAALESLLALVR
ncbi:MAG TPA: hypothetical protein VHW65_12275 [Gemmatimonadales bacterium]|nr:hypothetical protein [Gemmatimonadales bacterium]